MRAWTRDKPIYPWSRMAEGETIIWPIGSTEEARNVRRNVSQNGVRNGKIFRVKLHRKATPPVMHVTRVR
jgi:hypothetical protein